MKRALAVLAILTALPLIVPPAGIGVNSATKSHSNV